MLRPIVLFGDEVLEKPAEPVTNISDAEVQLVQDMVETMYNAPGVGLAANQVGADTDTSRTEFHENHVSANIEPKSAGRNDRSGRNRRKERRILWNPCDRTAKVDHPWPGTLARRVLYLSEDAVRPRKSHGEQSKPKHGAAVSRGLALQ